jgi:non-specific serine/threonine protein kinase
MVRGHLGEARQWLERALPRSSGLDDAVRAKALNAAGVLAGLQGDNEQAEAWFQESLELWRRIGDISRVAATVGNLGLVAENRQDVDRALELFLESQALYERVEDERGIAVSLGARAWLERQKGNDADAVPLLERSVALFRTLGDHHSLANSLANLGHSTLALGDAKQSAAYFTESLELRRSIGNTLDIAECLEGFAALAMVAVRPRRAARLYAAAEVLREITGAKLVDPTDAVERERQIDEIRKRLGETTFAADWGAGRALTAEAAVRLALQPSMEVPEDRAAQTQAARRSLLTRREREVAALVARGFTNRQMAETLLVAPRTIETHLEHIFAKLGVQTRAEVAAWAARQEVEATAKISGL